MICGVIHIQIQLNPLLLQKCTTKMYVSDNGLKDSLSAYRVYVPKMKEKDKRYN